MVSMKRWIVLTLGIFFIVDGVHSKGFEMRKKVGEYEMEVKLDRHPPVVGENGIEIKITGGSGRAVTDARVLINYYMPPMPRMAPMNYKIEAKLKKERYMATMNLIMSGPWIIAVKISRGEKNFTAKLNIDVP
jgi:hypothetical protein